MGRPKELTKTQIGNIRAGIARHATRVGNRLAAYVEGDLELTPGQVRACGILLQHTLPAMQSTQIEDVTMPMGDAMQVRRQFESLLVKRLMDTGMSRQEAEDTLRRKPKTQPATPMEQQPEQPSQPELTPIERASRASIKRQMLLDS